MMTSLSTALLWATISSGAALGIGAITALGSVAFCAFYRPLHVVAACSH